MFIKKMLIGSGHLQKGSWYISIRPEASLLSKQTVISLTSSFFRSTKSYNDKDSTNAASHRALAGDKHNHLVFKDKTMSSSTYLRIKLLQTILTLEMILLISD